jgi:hypothetical protein
MSQSKSLRFWSKSNYDNLFPSVYHKFSQVSDIVLFGAKKSNKKTAHGDFGDDSARIRSRNCCKPMSRSKDNPYSFERGILAIAKTSK